MSISERLKPWLGRKSVKGALVVVVFAILVAVLSSGEPEVANIEADSNTVVRTTTASNYTDGQSLSLLGNVRAFTEAKVTSERAGRVTSVNTTLGQQVPAGTIIATLENASERASVLQAEGAYESALASAAQSNVGVGEASTNLTRAKNSALTEVRSAYNSMNNIVISDIDVYFNQPQSPAPRLEIAGKGNTRTLEVQRVAIGDMLSNWQSYLNTLTVNSDLQEALNLSAQNAQKVLNSVDIFLTVFEEDEDTVSTTEFTNLRSSIINIQSSLDSALTGLKNAEDAVRRAELVAAGGVTSSADAQVKQALGSLRAAQANLAKTILRSPISGTVNSLSVRTGDFINSFTEVAVVANNSALEIITSVGDDELKLINEGDEVLVEGEYTGVITQIAPAVNSNTGKTEVRVATENADIANNDTVRITKAVNIETVESLSVQIPITAVRFNREDGFVFLIENDELISRTVTVGQILGNSVEIVEGLGANEAFVIDARGLVEGEKVEVQN